MIDLTKIIDEAQIRKELAKVTRRTGLYGGEYFNGFVVGNFTFIVKCCEPEEKKNDMENWTPTELIRLPKIMDYKEINLVIYEKPSNKSKYPVVEKKVRISADSRFMEQDWADLFDVGDGEGRDISTDTLIEIIIYCQVITNLGILA